jgi:hypothetical protein
VKENTWKMTGGVTNMSGKKHEGRGREVKKLIWI